EAVAAARRAVDLAPNEARPHEVLGDVALRTQETSLARRAYRDAARLDPGNAHVADRLRELGSSTLPRVRPVRPVREPSTPKQRRPPERPTDPSPPPARFGRAQRTALWLLVRRAAIWLAIGSFVLLIAGLPSPS